MGQVIDKLAKQLYAKTRTLKHKYGLNKYSLNKCSWFRQTECNKT